MSLAPRTLLYLRRQLARSPADEAAEIVAARSIFQQSAPTDEAEEVLDARLVLSHGELEWELSRIRSDFWLDSVDSILHRLGRLDASGHPDMQVAVQRLRRVAGLRGQFDELQQRHGCDPQFLMALRGVLVEPAQQAAVIRSHIYESLLSSTRRSLCQHSAKQVLKHVPELAELERSWLQEISEITVDDLMIPSRVESHNTALGCLMIVTVPITCYFAYRVVAALL